MSIYYIHTILYRTASSNADCATWCRHILRNVLNHLKITRRLNLYAWQRYFVQEPVPTDHWPAHDKTTGAGRYDIYAKQGDIDSHFDFVPDDSRTCAIYVSRHKTTDILRDSSMSVICKSPDESDEPTLPDLGNQPMRDFTAIFSLNTLLCKSDGTPASRAVRDVLCSSVQYDDCYYGFATIDEADASSMGWLYGPDILYPYDPVLEREEVAWRMCTSRAATARGVYWGNLWRKPLVDRMIQTKVMKIVDQAVCLQHAHSILDGVVVELLGDGSVYCQLTDNALDSCPESGSHFEIYKKKRNALSKVLSEHNLVVNR